MEAGTPRRTILALGVTEVFGDGETSQSDTGTGSRGLVHLTEDQGDLGLAIQLNDGCLLHFMVQIVTLTGALADTGEDRVTTVGFGDVVDELLDEDGLADTGTTEQANLSATGVRSQEIDDLDTSDKNLGGGGLVGELRRLGVDGQKLVGLDGATLVDGVTSDVDDTTEGARTDGNGDGCAGVGSLGATDETLGTCARLEASTSKSHDILQPLTVHGDAADNILTQVLLRPI